MTLQFVLGKASQDHQAVLIDILKNKQKDFPNDTYFYIVPNHIKFETEIQVIKQLNEENSKITAQSQLQVFSFSRLSWYFLRDTPQYQRQRISPAGTNMLLYQIINRRADDLYLFGKDANKPGFLQKLARQINEVQLGNIQPNDLFEILETQKVSDSLSDKLHDFSIIYQEYIDQIYQQYFDNSNGIQLLNDYLVNADLQNYHFIIDGFNKLSAQEMQILNILIQKSASVTISLNLDREYRLELPNSTNIFYQPAKLFNYLYKFASANQVPYLAAQYANHPKNYRDLEKLEDYWIQSNSLLPITVDHKIHPQSIKIIKAENKYSELLQITSKIRQLVATGNYRYTDFLILTRHLDGYRNIIEAVFKMQNIPYFMDIQKQMIDHPFVEFLAALFEIDGPNLEHRSYRYQDMMRLLKSELLIPIDENGQPMELKKYRHAVNLLDNAVLKNGYLKSQWLQTADWQGLPGAPNEDEIQLINYLRHFVKDTLPQFYNKLFNSSTNQMALTTLYQFLNQTGVLAQLKQWQKTALEQADLNTTNQIEQIWNTFCQISDEFANILGDQPFMADTFCPLIQAGFQGANYSQIPSTLDQVAISESGMVQANTHKVTIMIGSTNEQMPAMAVEEQLFGDDDKNQLEANLRDDQYLNDRAQLQVSGEVYLNYLAFMSGRERLIFSYALSDGDEQSIKISPYVERIKDYFKIKEINHPAIPNNDQPIEAYLGTKQTTLHHLIQIAQNSFQQNQALSPIWQYVYNLLINDANYKSKTKTLISSINYRNIPTKLLTENVINLYGQNLKLSISQLEKFYSNPYEYFLRYGLKLHERDEFGLSSQSTGNFFHEALDMIFKLVNNQNVDLVNLDEQALGELINEAVYKMIEADDSQYYILKSSNRMKYLAQKLQATIKRMLKIMQKQQTFTGMRPKKTEINFGVDGLKPLTYKVSDQHKVSVRGRIDRIDTMIDSKSGQRYVGIVDYKSSQHEFDFVDAYNGISMQLPTYLQVVQDNLAQLSSADTKLAGALYLHLKNSKLSFEKLKSQENLESTLLRDNKYDGLIVKEEDDDYLLPLLDQVVQPTESSLIFPFGINKDNSLKKASKVISDKALDNLLAHNQRLIIEAGQRIYDGDISLEPYRKNQESKIMQYSPYKSIMNFDPLLGENNYRDGDIYQDGENIEKLNANLVKKLLEQENRND